MTQTKDVLNRTAVQQASDLTKDMWGRVACESLDSTVERIKAISKPPGSVEGFKALSTPPEAFPDKPGLDSRINTCAPKLTSDKSIRLYDAVFSLQTEFTDYTPDAAYELTHRTDGKPLSAADQNRLTSIIQFPENPQAAMLTDKKRNGGTLDVRERATLKGAEEFPTQAFAAGLAALEALRLTTPSDDALLLQFRLKKRSEALIA